MILVYFGRLEVLDFHSDSQETNVSAMVLTDDVKLPSDEELSQKEIPLTFNYFLSSAMWLGKFCDNQSKEFMLCRKEEMDPRKCLGYGNELTRCGFDFFKKVKKSCGEELEWYTKCLDFSGSFPVPRRCRKEQAIFDSCMYDSGFERAKFGHFQMIRVHESDRERPKHIIPLFPDSVESYDIYDPANQQYRPNGLAGSKYWNVWFGRG